MRVYGGALVAVLALGAGVHAQETLRYAPEEGTVLRRNFEVKHFLALTRSVTKKSGTEEVGVRTFDLRNVETLQTSDRVLKWGDGRPLIMRRYFDRGGIEGFAELSEAGRALNMRVDGTSRLKGKSVMFTWVPEDDTYGRYFDAADGVEEDLWMMREDLDLRGFLPAAPVVVGDTWVVPVSAMGDALSPGGMLSFDFSKSKSQMLARTLRLGTGSHLFELFSQEMDGEVSATLKGVEESEDRRVAVVAVEWNVSTTSDIAELARRNRAGEEVQMGRDLIGMDVGLELKGEGTLWWDLQGNHLDSYDFSSAEDIHTSIRTRMEEDGPIREEILEMGGRVIVTGAVQRRES